MMFKLNGILLLVATGLAGGPAAPAAERAVLRKPVASFATAARGGPNKELGLQLASSFDAGDAYQTATGPRKLRRLAGAIALPAGEVFPRQFTGPGQPLEGYAADPRPAYGFSIYRPSVGSKRRRFTEFAQFDATLRKFRATAEGQRANPVFIDPDTGLRLLATTNLIVCLKPGVEARAYFGTDWKKVQPLHGTPDQFLLALPGASAEQILSEATRRASHSQVHWVEPDFVQQMVKTFTPNDPRFSDQWHLQNTAQFGATAGADVKLPGAWDITLGSTNIVIAIIDDGAQVNHPDLVANIFRNAGELPGNGVDDDDNGIIDDVNGWDFYGNDGNPSPEDPEDNHGTALAGVATAVGNNALGVSGAAPRCKVMPLKVLRGTDGLPISELSGVVRYAAGLNGAFSRSWRGADLISISLLFPRSFVVDSALTDAATRGRNGRGCPVFCAAGNSAGAWRPIEVEIPVEGTYTLRWQYSKDVNDVFSIGADTAWLDAVSFPNGQVETFENSGLPAGWTTGGNAGWTRVTDSVNGNHAMTGWNGPNSHALRAGRISHNQVSWLQVTKQLTAGTLTFWSWTESEAGENEEGEFVGYDGLEFLVDGEPIADDFGVPILTLAVGYPANFGATIAVGASTDFDFRSDYSQFGAALDFVASSDGGYANITTTDRTGAAGYNADPAASGDYTSRFGGTSAATPLAAGIGALILSVNPYLTSAEIRALLRGTCDQIGSESYEADDRNIHYGSGRLNATRAVSRALPNLRVTLSDARDPVVVGDITTYTLVVRNTGSSRSGPLRMRHQLPASVAFGSATPAPASRMGNTLTFTDDGLPSGGSLMFSIVVTNTATGTSVSTATVTNDVPDGSLTDNTATATTLVVPVPLISISDVMVLEGNTGGTNALFHVTLSNPSSRPVAVRFATSGQTATSGRDFAPLSGRLLFAPGETDKTISVRVNGDLADEDNETLAVTLSAPTNAVLAEVMGVGTIIDNDMLPTLSINHVTVTEANSGAVNAIFRVRLAPASGRAVTVLFETVSGGAVQGSDFIGTNGTLTFLPGQVTKTIAVKVLGDVSRETNETFFVNLGDATNATLTNSAGVGTIINNDATPKLSVNDTAVSEGNDGITNAIFNVRLAPASGLPVSVWWFPTNGTAALDEDFAAGVIQLLTFAPGETNQTIAVGVKGDRLSESNETFLVRLVSPTHAMLADATGLGAIRDDDLLPVLNISDAAVTENPIGTTNAIFSVTLSAVSGRSVRVRFATATNSARGGTDFVAKSGILTFPAGTTNQTISIAVNRDNVLELDEFFFVNLTSPVNATLGDEQATGTIVGPVLPALAAIDFSLTTVALTEAGLRLRFQGIAGQHYCLESCLDLREPGEWKPVPGADNLSGTGETIEVMMPVSTTGRQCFFRCTHQVRKQESGKAIAAWWGDIYGGP